MEAYWNHNSAYHDEIVAAATRQHGRVLDVGCGEGLLAERLAPVSCHGRRAIRATAKRELPDVRIRRGLYYRYILRWRKA